LTSLFAAYFGSSDQMEELIAGFVSHLSISPNLSDIMAIVEKGDFPRENLEILLDLFKEYKSTFPEYADICYMLGLLYRKLDRSKDAERCFNESLRLNPTYVKARMSLFQLLKEEKRYTEALEHGYSLDRLNLPYPDLCCGLGETLYALCSHSEAKRFTQKALDLNPTYPAAQEVLQRIQQEDTGLGAK
jgi:tetratricopeptide (TPR) repeat protein